MSIVMSLRVVAGKLWSRASTRTSVSGSVRVPIVVAEYIYRAVSHGQCWYVEAAAAGMKTWIDRTM